MRNQLLSGRLIQDISRSLVLHIHLYPLFLLLLLLLLLYYHHNNNKHHPHPTTADRVQQTEPIYTSRTDAVSQHLVLTHGTQRSSLKASRKRTMEGWTR